MYQAMTVRADTLNVFQPADVLVSHVFHSSLAVMDLDATLGALVAVEVHRIQTALFAIEPAVLGTEVCLLRPGEAALALSNQVRYSVRFPFRPLSVLRCNRRFWVPRKVFPLGHNIEAGITQNLEAHRLIAASEVIGPSLKAQCISGRQPEDHLWGEPMAILCNKVIFG